MSGPPSPGRAGGAQQDAAQPGCHAAGAAQLEMQHVPTAACPPLPDTSCPVLRSARGCSQLSLVLSIRAGHDGSSSRTTTRHPGDLWLSTSSDLAQRRWKCRITSSPDLPAVQLLPFPGIPFSQHFPAVPGCLTQRPQTDTHPSRSRLGESKPAFQVGLSPEEKSSISSAGAGGYSRPWLCKYSSMDEQSQNQPRLIPWVIPGFPRGVCSPSAK